jgi:ADP-ribose pyrophosphatase
MGCLWSERSLESRDEFSNNYFTVKRDLDSSRNIDYTYISFRRPGVRIIAQDDEGGTLLVRQYRHPVGGYTWELPAGGVEEGETALAAAKRELLEESGFTAKAWVTLGKTISLPNVTNFTGLLFLARNLTRRRPLPRSIVAEEVERFHFFSDREIRRFIVDGRLCDEKSLASIMILQAVSNENWAPQPIDR